ncbi:MAG TPA: cytochrome c oxidase subunit 4 [Microbacterium sp.]|uniref:cytochrome c oxidase subunit 4 n=1 Tax=Microbacterium sp. TaxID=51671 RepID=UPI002B480D16|nr:cytochrome c oxidase subunit 4 [Microbacterium sp.]HKT58344.1 cytochrome c oxidase subunit 4 [Microbacterium sp.]
MRSNVNLWWILSGFFLVVTIMYTVWNIGAHPDAPWYDGIEWVGSVALLFATLMSALIAFYIGRVHNAQGGELPEDVLTSDIDDGDPELGEFSPWSWWPIVLALAASFGMIGLAVGTWMFPIGLAIFVVAIVGWVYEYYRGYFAR